MRTFLLFLCSCSCSALLATVPPFGQAPNSKSYNDDTSNEPPHTNPIRAQLTQDTGYATPVRTATPINPASGNNSAYGAPVPSTPVYSSSSYPSATSTMTSGNGMMPGPSSSGYPTSALLSMPSSMDLLDNKIPMQPGESFSYAVLEDLEEPVALYVDMNGDVNFPLIGKHSVTGKTPRQLAREIQQELEKNYYFKATVILSRTLAAKGKVFISGQVGNPGSMEIPPSQVWTLSKTILTAGSFTEAADRSRVAIIRHDPSFPKAENRMEYDIGKMMETGDFSADPIVRPGDVIIISRLDMTARVTVSGQVLTPGVYNIPRRDFTVSQAVLSAGGLAKYGNAHKVRLIRQVPSKDDPTKKETTVIVIDLKKILEDGRRDLDPVVQPNDTISVPERLINF